MLTLLEKLKCIIDQSEKESKGKIALLLATSPYQNLQMKE